MSTGYPKKTFKHSYNTWEYAYFEYLIELRNTFASKCIEFYPEDYNYVYSEEFFYKFVKFVYDHSSKTISPYLKPLSENVENQYSKYLLKKEEFIRNG